MYFANDFYVTNHCANIGFSSVARLMAKYHAEFELIAAYGHDNLEPRASRTWPRRLLAGIAQMQGIYASWSIPAMGAVAGGAVLRPTCGSPESST